MVNEQATIICDELDTDDDGIISYTDLNTLNNNLSLNKTIIVCNAGKNQGKYCEESGCYVSGTDTPVSGICDDGGGYFKYSCVICKDIFIVRNFFKNAFQKII